MRGVFEPAYSAYSAIYPHLGIIANTVRDMLPRVADPDNAYWLYQGELPSFKRVVVGTYDVLSTIHPNYLFVAFFFVLTFAVLYIKVKYPFWNQLPALHIYDWHRRFVYRETPYIVHYPLAKKTKYYEPKLVSTKQFQMMTYDEKMEIVKLMQSSYFPSDRVFCSLTYKDIEAQLKDAVVSTFNQIEEDIVLLNNLNTGNSDNDHEERIERIAKNRKMEGIATSRRIHFAISLGKEDARTIIYENGTVLDYLCFHRNCTTPIKCRKLFHTHYYNCRQVWPDRNIMLFKKEVELCDAIVPLVEFDTYTFYMRHTIQPAKLPPTFQIVRIQKEHTEHLHDWMERIASLNEYAGFRVSITAEIGDLVHLLQTNQMYAYVLRGRDTSAYAIYFFRNAHMKYEDLNGGDTLHSVAAFCNTNNNALFFIGYLWAIKEARKDMTGQETKMVMIDDIGHLRGIVQQWKTTHDVVLQTKCAYYFCNYILPRSPYKAGEVNILF